MPVTHKKKVKMTKQRMKRTMSRSSTCMKAGECLVKPSLLSSSGQTPFPNPLSSCYLLYTVLCHPLCHLMPLRNISQFQSEQRRGGIWPRGQDSGAYRLSIETIAFNLTGFNCRGSYRLPPAACHRASPAHLPPAACCGLI